MGYAVRVDAEHLRAAAGELDAAGGALEEVADGLARALVSVSAAAGGGLLSQAATDASGRWRSGLREVAGQGESLARAVRQARADYLELERSLAGGWARGPRTGLVP
ncbi:WXG100 family type VII secretion target [uncultured Serinicoccus sp.]|uniref:WXG100 family type VII secretion target n=1 Tax=uncultured Serinicoccus sp. TaxID=735514 RepID=UPI002639C962|nr:hypothetical protein [uncultured Serinicoccus sp.]